MIICVYMCIYIYIIYKYVICIIMYISRYVCDTNTRRQRGRDRASLRSSQIHRNTSTCDTYVVHFFRFDDGHLRVANSVDQMWFTSKGLLYLNTKDRSERPCRTEAELGFDGVGWLVGFRGGFLLAGYNPATGAFARGGSRQYGGRGGTVAWFINHHILSSGLVKINLGLVYHNRFSNLQVWKNHDIWIWASHALVPLITLQSHLVKVIFLSYCLTVFKKCCGAPDCERNQQCSFSWLPELWIFFYFLIIFFFLSSKTIHQFLTLPTCGAFGKEMSCVKIHTHIVWAQEQFLQWSFKWTILQTFLNLLQEHGGIGVQDAVPAGMAPIDAVHAGAVPAGPIPAIAVAAAPDAVPAGRARGRARGRGQARGRGRGRAQGRGRARPDNAAADADAEADEGSKADKSDSDAEADQADRWARGRNALRASRRRGLLQARRDQLARSSKTKLQ